MRNQDRRGAKERTRNRFTQLDPDIASSYESYEEPTTRQSDSSVTRVINHISNRGGRRNDRNLKNAVDVRLNQVGRGAAGRNVDIVYKIKIVRGREYTIPWIVQQLDSKIDDFRPICPRVAGNDVIFFLRSSSIAEAVKAQRRRIVHSPSGQRVEIIMAREPAPWPKLTKSEIDTINMVVDSRYNSSSKALDLSEFGLDKTFVEKDMRMMLQNGSVMITVIERIDQKYGAVKALSLKGNRLRVLDFTISLALIAKNLVVFDLSDNMIDDIKQLEVFRGLPVETLFFEGNMCCANYTRSSDYLNAIQQYFPRVTMLDNNEVPANLVAAATQNNPLSREKKDVPPRPGFYPSDETRGLVETFVDEYFKLYDGENGSITRMDLLAAYDSEVAMFTLCLSNIPGEPVRYHDDDCYSLYMRNSHNLLQEEKFSRNRGSRTFRGALDIVATLKRLPITNHYRESFYVDVHLVTPSLLGFTVQGLFEDGTLARAGELPTLNYFSRNFVVAPRDGGAVAVISDSLYISAISPERMVRYKNLLNKCAATPPAVTQTTAAMNQISDLNINTVPSEDIRKQMVEQFCRQSGMLPEWSLKCLEDSNWNYDMALHNFNEARPNIPQEAFAIRV